MFSEALPVWNDALKRDIRRNRLLCVIICFMDIGAIILDVYLQGWFWAIFVAFILGVQVCITVSNFTMFNLNPENHYGLY